MWSPTRLFRAAPPRTVTSHFFLLFCLQTSTKTPNQTPTKQTPSTQTPSKQVNVVPIGHHLEHVVIVPEQTAENIAFWCQSALNRNIRGLASKVDPASFLAVCRDIVNDVEIHLEEGESHEQLLALNEYLRLTPEQHDQEIPKSTQTLHKLLKGYMQFIEALVDTQPANAQRSAELVLRFLLTADHKHVDDLMCDMGFKLQTIEALTEYRKAEEDAKHAALQLRADLEDNVSPLRQHAVCAAAKALGGNPDGGIEECLIFTAVASPAMEQSAMRRRLEGVRSDAAAAAADTQKENNKLREKDLVAQAELINHIKRSDEQQDKLTSLLQEMQHQVTESTAANEGAQGEIRDLAEEIQRLGDDAGAKNAEAEKTAELISGLKTELMEAKTAQAVAVGGLCVDKLVTVNVLVNSFRASGEVSLQEAVKIVSKDLGVNAAEGNSILAFIRDKNNDRRLASKYGPVILSPKDLKSMAEYLEQHASPSRTAELQGKLDTASDLGEALKTDMQTALELLEEAKTGKAKLEAANEELKEKLDCAEAQLETKEAQLETTEEERRAATEKQIRAQGELFDATNALKDVAKKTRKNFMATSAPRGPKVSMGNTEVTPQSNIGSRAKVSKREAATRQAALQPKPSNSPLPSRGPRASLMKVGPVKSVAEAGSGKSAALKEATTRSGGQKKSVPSSRAGKGHAASEAPAGKGAKEKAPAGRGAK